MHSDAIRVLKSEYEDFEQVEFVSAEPSVTVQTQ